uniref:Uncharacterized protein n=1 Tax=Microbotryum lychnidis-dioicae TaxID=288795 RepID=M1GMF2_9BASI|nr:hypothetical protein H911_mgp29 [Microbotryum lychnidis-dioicae]YP_007475393.1 hypothetical protein H911_mgp11 [Microbotryum lychnidis-dioicae]AGE14589.1 hypothetical protein [Microbotryum lychnidis-dioicae]AGE14607.1 hypothetical protein [Microbotryum lychnidis-dioicae]
MCNVVIDYASPLMAYFFLSLESRPFLFFYTFCFALSFLLFLSPFFLVKKRRQKSKKQGRFCFYFFSLTLSSPILVFFYSKKKENGRIKDYAPLGDIKEKSC